MSYHIKEGEYINGEINGKGKEFILCDALHNEIYEFIGEYKNGLKNGNFKEYYCDKSSINFIKTDDSVLNKLNKDY